MKRIILAAFVLLLTISGLNFETTQAKGLEVQAVSQSGTLPRNGVRVPLMHINLRTNNEAVTLKSVTLSRSGLSSHEDIGRVWLQQSYYRLSHPRQFTNDDQLTLEFTRDFVIPANTTERIYVLANLEFTGSGRTLQVNLENIESDAQTADPAINPSATAKPQARTPGVFTNSKSRYDRSQYRVQCRNSRCQLVKR